MFVREGEQSAAAAKRRSEAGEIARRPARPCRSPAARPEAPACRPRGARRTKGRPCASSARPARARCSTARSISQSSSARTSSAAGRRRRAAQQLLEQPRVAERSTREHHRVHTGALEGGADCLGAVQAAGEDHRPGERTRPAWPRGRSRACPCGGPARCAGGSRSPATPASSTRRCASATPSASPGAAPGAQLDGDRQAAALARGARDRDRHVGVVDQRRAGAGLADLRHRAAHVEVDEVGARAAATAPPPSA